jgi:hypothetical protein
VQGFAQAPLQNPAVLPGDFAMRVGRDGRVLPLFKELFPFGGQLEEDNRWMRIAKLIPWRELERECNTHFSHLGRPPLPLSTV